MNGKEFMTRENKSNAVFQISYNKLIERGFFYSVQGEIKFNQFTLSPLPRATRQSGSSDMVAVLIAHYSGYYKW